MRYLVVWLLFGIAFVGYTQSLSKKEQVLYQLIMDYRNEEGLPPIPLSTGLCLVAKVHTHDLYRYPPKGKCNLHSWSNHGDWRPVCYTGTQNHAERMWMKPKEIAGYTSSGYEIAFWSSDSNFSAQEVLNGWKSSPGHNKTIINKGIWNTANWQAIGISVYKNYAVVWFGEATENK